MISRILTLILCFSTPSSVYASSPLFSLVDPANSNVQFNNKLTESESLNILTYEYFYNGGGVAAGDINNDGLCDLIFTGNMVSPKLYLNKGNFKFQDITNFASINTTNAWRTGVSMADVNADGWLDIYICKSGKYNGALRQNELYINNRDLTFSESAKKFGLADSSYSTQAAFFDFDKDGDLDCYLLNHNVQTFKNFDIATMRSQRDPLAGDKLFENRNGYFNDISEAAGIKGSAIGFGLGIAIADFNNDGWEDIYICNDYTEPDYLYINKKNGTFVDSLSFYMGHTSQFSMGCDAADVNNDGLPDLITVDMLPEDNFRQKLMRGPAAFDKYQMQVKYGYHHQVMRNNFHLNNGRGVFLEIGQMANISNTDWSWAPLFADFNHDGLKDLFITNGYPRNYINMDFMKYTYEDAKAIARNNKESIKLLDVVQQIPPIEVANYLFSNKNGWSFQNISSESGFSNPITSNGAIYADLDNDGDLDLVTNNINSVASIHQNNTNDANFIKIKLQSATNNTYAYGAKVAIENEKNSYHLHQQPCRGFQSSVAPILHAGVAPGKYQITVTWPDGTTQKIINIANGSSLTIDQDLKKREMHLPPESSYISFDTLDFIHKENTYIDFKREPLLPHFKSICSPHITTGDINNDGLIDFFITNAAGGRSQLMIQNKDGLFESIDEPFNMDSLAEDAEAAIVDVNHDQLLDIIIAAGSYEFSDIDPRRNHKIYVNKGNNQFDSATNLPTIKNTTSSCITSADIDRDGDDDLFIGSAAIPGSYGAIPQSLLLINDHGQFMVDTTRMNTLVGMVNDAVFHDMDCDGWPDLIVATEWGPIKYYRNNHSKLEAQEMNGLSHLNGWWNTIHICDVNNDGYADIIAGNKGENEQWKVTDAEPLRLYVNDFDNNGAIDPIMTYYINHQEELMPSRDELLDQIVPLRKKYIYYAAYAKASINNTFSEAQLKNLQIRSCNQMKSGYFLSSKGNTFTFIPFSFEAQAAPINAITSADINGDDFPEIIIAGNNEHVRAEMGRNDAMPGYIVANDSGALTLFKSLNLKGECRSLSTLKVGKKLKLIIGINNRQTLSLPLNKSLLN
ncbi:MAG: hypothetical protein RIQ89_208 [Bacteroidota bacterium]|jgi:hypothetical protein